MVTKDKKADKKIPDEVQPLLRDFNELVANNLLN